MRYLLLLLILGNLLINGQAFAQKKPVTKASKTAKVVETERIVYTKVEDMPVFPGGKTAMVKFIIDHMGYSEDLKRGGEQSGTVFVQFIISPTGSVIEPKVTKSVSAELDNNAIKIVSQMPKWQPGKKDGKPVYVSYSVPIKFTLKD